MTSAPSQRIRHGIAQETDEKTHERRICWKRFQSRRVFAPCRSRRSMQQGPSQSMVILERLKPHLFTAKLKSNRCVQAASPIDNVVSRRIMVCLAIVTLVRLSHDTQTCCSPNATTRPLSKRPSHSSFYRDAGWPQGWSHPTFFLRRAVSPRRHIAGKAIDMQSSVTRVQRGEGRASEPSIDTEKKEEQVL